MAEDARSIGIDKLRDYPIFHDMSDEQVEAAARSIRLIRYKKNTQIWTEGEEGDDVALLLSGEIVITQRLTLFTAGGREAEERDKSLIRLSAEMRPVIGEIALCAHVPRSASVIAATDVTLGHFTAEELEAEISRDPHFGYLLFRNLASIIARRLITANQNVLKLTTAFSLAVQRGS